LLLPRIVPQSIEAAAMVRGRIKMRSAASLFKNRPGSSKNVTHRNRRLQNITGLPNNVGIIC
jgi:hypothetical protein